MSEIRFLNRAPWRKAATVGELRKILKDVPADVQVSTVRPRDVDPGIYVRYVAAAAAADDDFMPIVFLGNLSARCKHGLSNPHGGPDTVDPSHWDDPCIWCHPPAEAADEGSPA